MKNIVNISLIIIIGLILTSGCVGQIKNVTPNNTTIATPENTFVPILNSTGNISNITVTSGLKGPLRVSIGGWDVDLPVSIDNQSVGIARKDKPLDLMLDEGNHTVKVCAGTICLEDAVTIQFAQQRYVDFEERLISEVEFPRPTARIIGFNPSGALITIDVEFINPSPNDLSMSAEVKCGYTYIEGRTNNRVGGSAQGIITTTVGSGQRTVGTLYLYLPDGYSYTHSTPVISAIRYR